MKNLQKRKVRSKIKCVKVRALFPENKVRFARVEQLCLTVRLADGTLDVRMLWLSELIMRD